MHKQYHIFLCLRQFFFYTVAIRNNIQKLTGQTNLGHCVCGKNRTLHSVIFVYTVVFRNGCVKNLTEVQTMRALSLHTRELSAKKTVSSIVLPPYIFRLHR